jgi:hypothetical protein
MTCHHLSMSFCVSDGRFTHVECTATRGPLVIKIEEANTICSTERHLECPLFLGKTEESDRAPRQEVGRKED